MPTRPTGDRALKLAAWLTIRRYWTARLQADPRIPCAADRCLLPGQPIRITGKRGRDSLDVGHIVPRVLDDRTTWRIEDTRPEHARCGRSHGARLGNQRRARRRSSGPALILDDW